jgi:hypothetical protein
MKEERVTPFGLFCQELWGGDRTSPDDPSSVQYWAERIRCREPDLVNWALDAGFPENDELVRMHQAIMREGRIGHLQLRWGELIQRTVAGSSIESGYSVTEGEGLARPATYADLIEDGLWASLYATAAKVNVTRRLELLQKCIDHAEVLSHYHKQG